MNQTISPPLTLKYDMSVFRNEIRDMIQWHPGEFSFWTADNIQNVNSIGLESTVNLDYNVNDLKAGFILNYSFTKATTESQAGNNDISKGRQLIYIPENQANISFKFSMKRFYSLWLANLTGRRYITVDNSDFLPGYFLNNIVAGIKLNLRGNYLDMNLTIDNAFNVNYQSIAHYPLPGRSYLLKVSLQIVK